MQSISENRPHKFDWERPFWFCCGEIMISPWGYVSLAALRREGDLAAGRTQGRSSASLKVGRRGLGIPSRRKARQHRRRVGSELESGAAVRG